MTVDLVRSDDLSTWTLEQLGQVAKQEHQLVLDAVVTALEHAIKAGEALLQSKETMGWGQFTPWLQSLEIGYSTAYRYMRIAAHKFDYPDGVTLKEAERMAPGLKRSGAVLFSEDRVEAVRLREEGLTIPQIGAFLGISDSTAYRWTDPKRKQWEQRRRTNQREAKLALRDRRRKEAAKKAGGSLEKAYSTLRVHQQAIDHAISECADREVAAALRSALAFAYRAEDKIAEALRVS